MKKRLTSFLLTLGTMGIALQLAACAPSGAPINYAVSDAYESSGVIHIAPYNRTIFSSNNF